MQALAPYLDFIATVLFLIVGYVVGRIAESRHYRSIERRERALAGVHVFSNRFAPTETAAAGAESLVAGSVVISEDYFKRMVGALYSFIGGRVKSYESLLDRARREAVLRMKAEAAQQGARMIINVKFQTFAIPGRSGNIGAVEMLAYGTALRVAPGA